MDESGRNSLGVLNKNMSMRQQHLYSIGNCRGNVFVYRTENPSCFNQYDL